MNLFQVNLFVNEFPAMLRFYRDALGFETNDVEPGAPEAPEGAAHPEFTAVHVEDEAAHLDVGWQQGTRFEARNVIARGVEAPTRGASTPIRG